MSPSTPNHVGRQATSFKQNNSHPSLYKGPVTSILLKVTAVQWEVIYLTRLFLKQPSRPGIRVILRVGIKYYHSPPRTHIARREIDKQIMKQGGPRDQFNMKGNTCLSIYRRRR
jgi:hypothetical protein